MSTKAVKVAISIPKKDFKLLEILRKRLGISRSALIDRAIRSWLAKKEEEEMVRQYIEGYKRMPETPDEMLEWEKLGLEAFGPEEKWQ